MSSTLITAAPVADEPRIRSVPALAPSTLLRRRGAPEPVKRRKTPRVWRYEFKYLVPRSVRTPLVTDLRAFVEPDRHAEPDGYYDVRSLYLDSADWVCFYEKLAGTSQRCKLRVRSYLANGKPASPIKVEVKRRSGLRISKDVTIVPLAEYERMQPMLESRHLTDPRWAGRSSELDAFLHVKQMYGMVPVVNVQFRRQAFTARTDHRVRITLDDRLSSGRARSLLDPVPAAPVSLTAATSVLEIKLDRTMPFWAQRLIAKYRLRVESVSKYCRAVACGPFGLDGIL